MNYKDIKSIEDIKITTDYIPYIQKVSECKNIADITSHKEVAGKKVFVADSTTRHLFYIMKLVSLYTDIEFEDNELVDAYDELNKNSYLDILFGQVKSDEAGAFSAIPLSELREFKSIMDMTMDDVYENERSTSAILGNMKDALSMVLGTMLEAAENATEENPVKIELKTDNV